MNGHSNYDYARDDAKFLKSMASAMTYNFSNGEAVRKHRLNEIAMRLETKFYVPKQADAEYMRDPMTLGCAAVKTLERLGYTYEGGEEWTPPTKRMHIGHGTIHVKEKTPDAPALLDQAAKHMRDRAATYDKPEGERSMAATVEAFNAITGRDLDESEGWLLMALLKMVRSQQRREPHRDSVEDLVAYSALFGEARLGGR